MVKATKYCLERGFRLWQVSSGDCPHLLFYGPPGAGKKTLIIGLLRQIYGPAVEKVGLIPLLNQVKCPASRHICRLPVYNLHLFRALHTLMYLPDHEISRSESSRCLQIKVETKPWKIALPSRNIEIELTTVQSNYHVEMNPSDVGNQDRHIVQEVIKVCLSWHSVHFYQQTLANGCLSQYTMA